MKNRKRKNIILVTIIILVISIIFFMKKDNKIYKEEIDNNKVTLAIMVEKAREKYVEYRSKEWPKYGYRYAYAKCVDKNKNDIGNLITFDARTDTAIMKSKKTAFCTLYFAIDKELPSVVDGTFYIGKTIDKEYTNNQREEIHITLKEDTITKTIDVIEYCLVSELNKDKCEWKELPRLDKYNSFVVNDYDLGSGDGNKTVYLYLKDGAKNISEPVEDSIILDTVAPSCTLWGESTIWTKDDRTITWGCSDDSSGCNTSYSGGSKKYTETTKTADISSYEIRDNAGNITTCQKRTANVYVDKTAPSCTSNGDSTSWTKDDRTITWGCSDSHSGCNTSYSGGSKKYTETTKTADISSYEIRDNVGNITTCQKRTANVYVDKKPPYAPKTMGFVYGDWESYTNNSWTNKNVYAAYAKDSKGPSGAIDEHSGIAKYQISKDNKTWVDYNYDISKDMYKISAEGTHIRYYRACDNVGNCGESISRTAKIDKTAPSCSIEGNPSNWQKTDATLTQNGTDSGQGTVYYSWDNKNSYSTTKSSKKVSSNGTYTLYVKDGLGNENSCSATVSMIDKTAPSCTSNGDSTSWTKDDRTITWGCSDSHSGCNTSYSGGSKKYTETIKTADISSYEIRDNAGNITTCQKRTANVYVDKTAPSCTNSGDSTSWTKDDRTITWGCSDSYSGCNTSYSGGSKKYTETIKTADISSYEIRDNAGNITTCQKRTANVYIDKTAPSCTNNGDSTSWTKNDRTITWGCSDSHSGCNTSYSGGSKKYTETTKTADILSYEIRDNAGNITTCQKRTANVYIDKTAPEITFGIDGTETATYSCTDEGGSLLKSSASGTKSLTGTSNIDYSVTCEDNAGNSTTSSHTYTYDGCASGENTCQYGCDTCTDYSKCISGKYYCTDSQGDSWYAYNKQCIYGIPCSCEFYCVNYGTKECNCDNCKIKSQTCVAGFKY